MRVSAADCNESGVAQGANVSFEAILALNVRTEISMGLMTDGCTSLAWKTDDFSLAGQNWDVRLLAMALFWEMTS